MHALHPIATRVWGGALCCLVFPASVNLLVACSDGGIQAVPDARSAREIRAGEAPMNYTKLREEMVRTQIEARGVSDVRVLDAMRSVPRHEFVPDSLAARAYEDNPLPIGDGQTISQPYIVAAMSELARIGPGSRVLEVGTGSGYQAAVLHEIAGEIYSIEIVEALAGRSADLLERLGYESAHVRHGDGYRGWKEFAPFDAILVTAAPTRVPEPLLEQLREGGRLVVPVGEWYQELEVHTRTADGFRREKVFPVRFVPMTGEIQEPR
jgi:protein-L-isoaspartate(D-aspartate) O-methyltransferase